MNIAKIKYRVKDNNVIIVETKTFVNNFTVKRQVNSIGKLSVFTKASGCYTLFVNYPNINEFDIGTNISVTFTEPIPVSCERVTTADLEKYLEKYCPVCVKRSYNKSTKLHTIIFTDKQREE